MKRLLIVTGSRSLATSEHAETARAVLEVFLARPALYIVTGDAPGPDEWAREWCYQHRHNALRVYAVGGAVFAGRGVEREPWTLPGDNLDDTPHERRPLLRNDRMVERCAELRDQFDLVVEAVGLIDGRSETHGTEHTLSIAKRLEIPCHVVRFGG